MDKNNIISGRSLLSDIRKVGDAAFEMFERYDTVDEEDILDAMKKLEKKCSVSASAHRRTCHKTTIRVVKY